jgi:hypothetical protein
MAIQENTELNQEFAEQSGLFDNIYPTLIPSVPVLTDELYQQGNVQRFFLQKGTNPDEPVIEVNSEQYTEYSGNKLFIAVSFSWQISGPQYDTFKDGVLVVRGVEPLNNEVIKTASSVMPKIKTKLKNPLQFWRGF